MTAPSPRSIAIAASIFRGFEVTDDEILEAASAIDKELGRDSEIIRDSRSEIVALLAAMPTRTFLGRPLAYWQNIDETLERLNEAARREQQQRVRAEQANESLGKFGGELTKALETVRAEFRELCSKQGVTLPCANYVALEMPSEGGSAVEGESGPCKTCGHPFAVHEPQPK